MHTAVAIACWDYSFFVLEGGTPGDELIKCENIVLKDLTQKMDLLLLPQFWKIESVIFKKSVLFLKKIDVSSFKFEWIVDWMKFLQI